MPTEVEVPGEGIFEFPDEVGESEIQSILRKRFPVGGFQDLTPDQPFVPATPKQPIPVEQLTTYGGPPKQFASMAETLVEPTEAMMNPRVTLPRLEIKESDPLALTAGKEAVNVLAGIPEFMSSNVGLLGMIGGAVAPVATAGAFTADLLNSLGHQVRDSYKNWDKMTPTEKTTAVVDMAGTGAFAGLLGTHTGHGIADRIVPARALAKEIRNASFEPLPDERLALVRQGARIEPPAGMVTAERMSAPFEERLATEPPILKPEPSEVPKFEETKQIDAEVTEKPTSAAIKDLKTGEIWSGEPTHGLLHDQIPDMKSRKLEAGFMTNKGNYWTQAQTEKATGLSSGEELFVMSPEELAQWKEVQAQQEKYRQLEEERTNPKLIPSPEKTDVAPTAPTTQKLSNKAVSTIWNRLVETSRDDLTELLVNWQDARLSDDGTKIIGSVGREREVKTNPSKKSFLEWLHGEDPFNPKSFDQNQEWVDLVNRTRQKTGLQPEPPKPALSPTEPKVAAAEAKPAETPVESPAEVSTTQPIPQGPGARTAQTIEAPESYSATALKNAVAEVERAGWGMAEAPEHVRKQIPEAWINAGRVLEKDPMAGEKLVDELEANPKGRGLSFDESALLLRHKVRLSNEMNRAAEATFRAKNSTEKDAAESAYNLAHENMLRMLDAIKERGTAWGQEGRWRQVMAREDFSLANLIVQREAALGKKIEPGSPEYAELEKHANRLQELNKQLEDRVAQVQAEFEASEVKRAMAEAQAQAAKPESAYHPRILELAENYAKKWDARGAKALENLKAMFDEGQAFSGAPISPAMLDNAIVYGTSKMVRGAVDLAKWTDAMVKDLGEGFRKYAKDVYDASKRAFDQDVATDFKKPEVQRKVKGALKGADLGTDTPLRQIAAKAAKTPQGKLPNIGYYLRKLGRVYAREGIKEEGPFLDRMTADVQKVLPNLTRDDVRAIFGGYAEEVRTLSKEPVEVILRDMRGQSQELHKLSLLKQKIIPPKLQERATPSEKQRQLRKQVEAEKRTGGFAPPDPEVQLRSAMQSAETRLLNQIADLEKEISTGQKIVQQKRAPLQSEKLDALRARRDSLREIHDEVFKKPDLTDAERLEIWKERVKEQIDELRDRRRRGDFKPKPKPDPIRFDKQAIELQFLKEVEHRALMEMRFKDEMAKRTTPEVIKDSLRNAAMFAHMAMAGGEFSAVLKQGATGAYSMPIRTARNFAKSLQAWWSEENQFKIKHDILTRDNAPFYRRDKLEFTDVGGRLSNMEEMYMFRVMDWMKRVPGLSHYVRYMDRFQRAFSTFLNLMRADTYDAMVREMGSSPEAGQSAANYINVATGRGSHSTARFGGAMANAVFFAPRWSISRFQYLLGQPIFAAKPGFKLAVAKQYAKTMIGLGSLYALGYSMGGNVDWNPTSSKFGKIQIGNRVIDPLFGLAPVFRLLAQQITGLRKNYRGQVRPIREGGKLPVFENQITGSHKLAPYDPSAAELIGKFAWSKLAPAPEIAVSGATGENVVGEKFSIPQKVLQAIAPITYVDVINAIRSEGIDEKTAIDLMSIFGLGSYVEKPKTSKPNF